MTFPTVFVTGKPRYKNNIEGMIEACDDALNGWKRCGRRDIPDNFGEGMKNIGAFLGVVPVSKNLSNKKIKLEKEAMASQTR